MVVSDRRPAAASASGIPGAGGRAGASLGVMHVEENAPASMLVWRDAGLYPRSDPERADEIEGSMGEGSYFDSSFGYYVHA